MIPQKYEFFYNMEEFGFNLTNLKEHGVMQSEVIFDAIMITDILVTYIEAYMAESNQYKLDNRIENDRRKTRPYIRENFDRLFDEYYDRLRQEHDVLDKAEQFVYDTMLNGKVVLSEIIKDNINDTMLDKLFAEANKYRIISDGNGTSTNLEYTRSYYSYGRNTNVFDPFDLSRLL